MLELALLFLGFGLGALAFGPRSARTPWFFGKPICPLCRKVQCYGVDAECKAFSSQAGVKP